MTFRKNSKKYSNMLRTILKVYWRMLTCFNDIKIFTVILRVSTRTTRAYRAPALSGETPEPPKCDKYGVFSLPMGASPHTPVRVSLRIKYIEPFFIFTRNWAGKNIFRSDLLLPMNISTRIKTPNYEYVRYIV